MNNFDQSAVDHDKFRDDPCKNYPFSPFFPGGPGAFRVLFSGGWKLPDQSASEKLVLVVVEFITKHTTITSLKDDDSINDKKTYNLQSYTKLNESSKASLDRNLVWLKLTTTTTITAIKLVVGQHTIEYLAK